MRPVRFLLVSASPFLLISSGLVLVPHGALGAPGDLILASSTEGGVVGNSQSRLASISADGKKVAFESFATNFSPTDTDEFFDVYVKDVATGQLTLASTSDVGEKAFGGGQAPSLSADGARVAFHSIAPNLDPADTDNLVDIYVKDLVTGEISIASMTSAGVKGNDHSFDSSLSSDGTKVAFVSTATNLHPGDTDNLNDIYVKDLASGEIALVSTSSTGVKDNNGAQAPTISGDGTKVAFTSLATNLDPSDTDDFTDVYVKDLATGELTLASTSDVGEKAFGRSLAPSLSADGARVAFHSNAPNLDPADADTNNDVYVKDLGTGQIILASISHTGVKGIISEAASVSGDGTKVALRLFGFNIDPSDTDNFHDVYVKDLNTEGIALASTSGGGVKGNSNSFDPSLSFSGSKVAFNSNATNLDPADTFGEPDVYVKELAEVSPEGCMGNTLPANDDASTGSVPLPFPLNFFGAMYSDLFVNNNGNVTFGGPLSEFPPFDLTGATGIPIIAPFFADVDTRNAASGVVTYGTTLANGRLAFCALWDGGGVGYDNQHADKLNKFELFLVERSDVAEGDFDIMFSYKQIQWETGDASGGSNGLGGNSARAGYSNGTGTPGTFADLPGSGVNGALLDGGPNALVEGSRNTLRPGRYVFPVRGGLAPTGGTVFGTVSENGLPVAGALVQVCGEASGCVTAITNSRGNYTVFGLPADTYRVRVFPPSNSPLQPGIAGPGVLAQNGSLGLDVGLTGPVPPPPDVIIGPARTINGIPVVYLNDPLTLEKRNQCTGASVTYEVRQGSDANGDGRLDDVIRSGTMAEDPAGSGTYRGTVQPLFPNSGPAQVIIEVDCPPHDTDGVFPDDPPNGDNFQGFSIYIDPSGVVLTVGAEPITGATVTLFRSDSSSGPFDQVPDGSAIMSPSNRVNPDLTDAQGRFGWDVIAGFYVVRAERERCHAPGDPNTLFVETEVLEIPPPVTDLDIRMECSTNQTPLAIDDSAQTRVGANITINVLANDSDPDNDPLTVTGVSDPPSGAATVSPNNTVTYDPDGCFAGTDTFTYTINDGLGGTDTATVTVRVRRPSRRTFC